MVLFVPTSDPLICHWYEGLAPPLTGIAVKVILVFPQTVVEGEEIVTAGVKLGLTVTTVAADRAEHPVALVTVTV